MTQTKAKKVTAKKKVAAKKKAKSRMYFTNETQDAIIKYNATDNMVMRNKIFKEEILYPFQKIVENIFNKYKFMYFDVEPSIVQEQALSYLVSKLEKYTPDKKGPSRAFAYFSVVAKNWFILQNNSTWKRWNQHVEIMDKPEEDTFGEILMTYDNENDEISEFVELMIEYWDLNMTTIFTKRKELEIANAVLELFKNRDKIENFNKKTLYLYIREMSGCKTQNITKVINKMKEYQKDIALQYLNAGVIDNSLSSSEASSSFFD